MYLDKWSDKFTTSYAMQDFESDIENLQGNICYLKFKL